jgi:hypothetical protein
MKSKDFLSHDVSMKVRKKIPSLLSYGYINCDFDFVGTFEFPRTKFLDCDKPLFLFPQVRDFMENKYSVVGTVVIDKTLEPKYAWVIQQFSTKYDRNFGWSDDILSPELYRTRKEAEEELVTELLNYVK